MDRYKIGMPVRSMAGHDAGHLYIIMEVDEAYVYLVDGKIRTLHNKKKKKKKHVQLINIEYDVTTVDDTAIKRILKELNKEERDIGGK